MTINVCLCSDNNFAPFVATTISSILLNTKEHISFYILSDNISDVNKELIKNGTEKFFSNYQITFIDINSCDVFSKCISQQFISRTMYARFLIPELLKDLDFVIYSDVDVCFTGDISLLSNENIGDYAVAAVPSQRGRINNDYKEFKKCYNLKKEHSVFMSGLLVINCKKWRQENIGQKLIELSSKEKVNDQTTLNMFFDGNNYYKLGNKYCVIYKLLDTCFSQEEANKLKNEQVIIHYPGGGTFKPWINPQLASADFFWNVVRFTSYSDILNNKYNRTTEKELIDYLSSFKNIIIYGAGLIGKLVATRLKFYPKLKNICFAVSDLKGNSSIILDYKVCEINELSRLEKNETVVILAMDYRYYNDIENTLNKLQFNNRVAIGNKLQNDLYLNSSMIIDEVNKLKKENQLLTDKINTLFELLNYTSNIKQLNKASGKLRIIQQADVLLLQIFHKVCKKSYLEYWLDFGTLLGAVRHKGFIPWDDDLDVAMPREDYEKVTSTLKSNLDRFGITVNQGQGFTHPVIRLLYKNTPIQLDIWPYDHIIQNTSIEEISQNIIDCNAALYKNFSISDITNAKIDFPKEFFYKIKERYLGSNSEKSISELFVSGAEALPYKKPNIFKRSDIYPLSTINFEDLTFVAPNNVHNYLKAIYGNYLSFPKSKVLMHGNIADKYESIDDEIINELRAILDCIE